MAGRKSDFTLTKLDDLFTTQAQRDEEQLSKIRDIPLELIDDFPDHPFKVRDDEDMMQLVESVKERGVITPATVRKKEDGRYELVSGHRRKRACELAGFETLRSEIVDLNRDEATILMVESNFQRSEILPSEKAFAYKMRLEALSRQGKRTDLTSNPLGRKLGLFFCLVCSMLPNAFCRHRLFPREVSATFGSCSQPLKSWLRLGSVQRPHNGEYQTRQAHRLAFVCVPI